MGNPVKVRNAIICYPHLFQKHAPPGTDRHTYSAELLLDPVANADAVAEIQAAFQKTAMEAGKGAMLQYLKSPLKNGSKLNEERAAKGQTPRPELAGKYVIRASDPNNAPGVCKRDGRTPIFETQSSELFGGCLVTAYIDLYWSGNASNPGVFCGLKGIQLMDNNREPIGGGKLALETMFDDEGPAPAPIENAPNPGAAFPGALPVAGPPADSGKSWAPWVPGAPPSQGGMTVSGPPADPAPAGKMPWE